MNKYKYKRFSKNISASLNGKKKKTCLQLTILMFAQEIGEVVLFEYKTNKSLQG